VEDEDEERSLTKEKMIKARPLPLSWTSLGSRVRFVAPVNYGRRTIFFPSVLLPFLGSCADATVSRIAMRRLVGLLNRFSYPS